jgi:glycosyltransferase involved in cell wall biosynthesis
MQPVDPKISVISACYNQGRYAIEMIESVEAQTFRDFEIVIVNDGSTDDTREILGNIKNSKVRVIHTDNRGPAAARNTAIESAQAGIIMNLDADDKIAPDLLEKADRVFHSNPKAGIVYCDAECFGTRSGRFEIGDYSRESMLLDNRITSLAFFRKEDWQLAGGYSTEFRYGLEDWDFWLKIIEMGRDVVFIPDTRVFYRTYPYYSESRSGRRKSDRQKMLESQVLIFKRHHDLISSSPEAFAFYSAIEKKFINENRLIRYVKNKLYKYMRKYYWK